MKKIIKYTVFLLFITIVTVIGCRKTEVVDISDLPNLGGDDSWVKGKIDNWIQSNLTDPFNIQVKFKFDQSEADLSRTLVPIKEELVIPSLTAMLDVFIQPYIKVRDENFMKTYVPKQVVYIGSPSYNTNGTITLGQAEGGKKILLLDMNNFSLSNKPFFIRMMHTMHHEFGHILNQKVPVNPDFEQVSKADYNGNWTQISQAEAISKGFVTPYAMSAPTEDFVEIVSTMLAEGKEYYENLVNSQSSNVQEIFKKKEELVVQYYKNTWNIDIYDLQVEVANAIAVYFPPPVFENLNLIFGNNGTFSSLAPDNVNEQMSESYKLAFTQAQTLFTATGRSILGYRIRMFKPDSLSILLQYSSGANNFIADVKFPYSKNASGELVIGNATYKSNGYSTENNANGRRVQLAPLMNFFSNKTFVPKWPNENPIEGSQTTYVGGWYLSTDQSSYILGTLGTNISPTY